DGTAGGARRSPRVEPICKLRRLGGVSRHPVINARFALWWPSVAELVDLAARRRPAESGKFPHFRNIDVDPAPDAILTSVLRTADPATTALCVIVGLARLIATY